MTCFLYDIFKQNSKKIKIYVGKETLIDPYEKNIETTELIIIPAKAIISDLIASQMQWKIPGINASKAKEIVIPKMYKQVLENSYKIEIVEDNEFYEGWRVNGKMQIREEGDFLRVYIYLKQV